MLKDVFKVCNSSSMFSVPIILDLNPIIKKRISDIEKVISWRLHVVVVS